MSYGYNKKAYLTYQKAIEKIKEELKKEGFGILTEIDVKAALKKKLDVNYDDYIILGVCNPKFAYKALQTEKEIGLMLPCNVIVYRDKNETFVSAILPTEAMSMIDNEELRSIAVQVEEKLKKAVDNV